MTLNELIDSDASWMFRELGQDITYSQSGNGQLLEIKAIVDLNGQAQLAYGYDSPLSKRQHEFTFLPEAMPDYTPKRGDIITFRGQQYTVNFVAPGDDKQCLVSAR